MLLRSLILILLFSTIGLAQTKAIPRINLVIAPRTGLTHAAIVWFDNSGVRQKERITQEQYDKIGVGVPSTPLSFIGTSQDWAALWTRGNQFGKPYALGGRPTYATSTQEPLLGMTEINPTNSRVIIYTGEDLDAGDVPILSLRSNEYTGIFPNITTTVAKCGLTIAAGQIQPGNLNVACSRNSTRN